MISSRGNAAAAAAAAPSGRASRDGRSLSRRRPVFTFAAAAAAAALSVAVIAAALSLAPLAAAAAATDDRRAYRCGTPEGQPLSAPRGVITTPLFPGPFPVPIDCEWVIQAEGGGDTMVEVYFTQLFVTDGLTITEYSQYPPDFGFVTVREVFNKSHISQYGQSMLTALPYLVVRFRLDRLEGNHIRVHDDLMDVYGFNITYETRPVGDERDDACSLYFCSYSGNCLGNADLTQYKCVCFPGFYGDNCGFGPICHPNNTDSCENGGTCRHVGRSIAICNCPTGFTGGKCEVPVVNITAECGSSSGCIQQCNINEDVIDLSRGPCPCNLYKNSSTPIDSVRYHATIKLVNISAIVNENVEEFLQQKIIRYFKRYLNSPEPRDLRITSILQNTGDVHFEFYSRKSDQKRVQDLLNHMITNGSLPGPVPLVKTALSFQQEPSLWLNKMDVNKPRDSIPEGEQFIISCMAQGPADMQFQWFKDGNPINTNISTRYMWTKIKKSEKPEFRSSILVIEHADVLDSGKFTCQVSDHSYQQCQSVAITVLPLPEVIMKPSVTVKPGDNVTIMCFLKNEFTKFGNTWLDSDLHLVKMDKNVYWEDLHRGGSVLYVKNITSSAEYMCEASNRAGRRNATVFVEVLDTNVTAYCAPDGVWPLTGAGKSASVECPKNRSTSYASRTCVLTADNVTEWQTADYSRCTPEDLGKITMNFRKKTLGYDKINVTAAKTLSSLFSDLQTTAKWYPGEGEPVIDFLMSVTAFLQTSHDLADLDQASVSFNGILSILLENDSIVSEKKIVQLLEMIETWTLLKAFYSIMNKGTRQYTNQIENIYIASRSEIVKNHNQTITHSFYDKQTANRSPQQPRVTVSMCDVQIDKWINKSFNVGVTTFRNLSEFFPKKYFINKSQDGEIEYSVMTPLVAVSVAQDDRRIRKHWPTIETVLEFELTLPQPVNGTWNVTCATAARLANVHQWDVSTCTVLGDWSPSSNVTRCRCPRAGLFAVLARVAPHQDEVGQSTLKQDVIVIFGCACCLVQCALSLVLLVAQWVKHPTCILYSKIQLCSAVVSQMCMFLYAAKNNDYGYFSLGLQIVTIVEMTSHLSQLLIVYTEIISFPQFSNIKLPIIGVATAAPLLFVLSIMLSLNIIGAKTVRPWWSWENSAFIYIYFVLFVLLMVMYLSVLTLTVPKLKLIKQKLQRNTPVRMRKRMGLIVRSVAILLMVVVTTVSSILHILYKEDFSKYAFSSSCFLKGFAVIYCYVLHSEDPIDLRTVYLLKSPQQQSTDDNHSDSDGSPLNCFSKDTIDFDIKKAMKSDILEITDNPQEYFITQEKPVSIVSNLTSSLKKLDSNTEPKKSVTFRHDLITGCQEKSMDATAAHESDCDGYGGKNCGGPSSHRNGGGGSCSPLLEATTATDAAVTAFDGAAAAAQAVVDDWQLVQADFVDVPPGGDTSIRCVVQPPPDMLATHVCVEVGLVKSSAAADPDKSEVPTIVVCSVDVEPCRQPATEAAAAAADKCASGVGRIGRAREAEVADRADDDEDDDDDDDVLDRISQDLDYLLNRKSVVVDPTTKAAAEPPDYGADRNPKKQQDAVDVVVQKRTKL